MYTVLHNFVDYDTPRPARLCLRRPRRAGGEGRRSAAPIIIITINTCSILIIIVIS